MAYITSWYWNKGDFRKVNEDSFTLQRVRARKKELIFAAVCDGIGGLRAGECASGLVAEQLTEWFYREGFWKMRSLFWTKQMKKRALDALLDMQEKLERCEREEKICSGTTVRNCREIICIFLESMLIYDKNEFSDSGGHFHGT